MLHKNKFSAFSDFICICRDLMDIMLMHWWELKRLQKGFFFLKELLIGQELDYTFHV